MGGELKKSLTVKSEANMMCSTFRSINNFPRLYWLLSLEEIKRLKLHKILEDTPFLNPSSVT
jgi:hypothetical protein